MEGDLDIDSSLKNENGMTENGENDSGEKMNIQESGQTSPEVEIPVVGKAFRSYEEVRNFYNRYAQLVGFGTAKVSTKNGDDGKPKYFSLACARCGRTAPSTAVKSTSRSRQSNKTNCKARMNIAVYDDGRYVVTRVCLDHNHELNPGQPQEFRCGKTVTSQLKRKLEVNDSAVVEMGCRNNVASPRLLRLGNEDVEALMRYFDRMQARNSNFFYTIDGDEEARIRNVFWADARCRAAYESNGDVIFFDTTYVTNGYDMPLVMFIGVNNHGDSMLFGCGLISRQDTDTFVWLFKSWLTCMMGCSPKAVITDQCRAVQDAIREVFPDSRHCLSLSHIVKKLTPKLKELAQYNQIKKTLKNIIYGSAKPNDFEESWKKLISEHNLRGNEWLKSLYDDRHHWAPVYVKKTFLAGISTAERGEQTNAFFDSHVESKTTVKQFIELYDNAMKSKLIKENDADFASLNSCIPTITNLPIEKQFQKIYTNEMFKLFQDELRGLLLCNASFVMTEGLISVFEVTESIQGKHGAVSKEMKFEVFFTEADCKVQCICHLFEFKGILCRHAISVLTKKMVNQVPSCYVLQRWRKDIKHGYKVLNGIYNIVDSDDQDKRRRKLIPVLLDLQQLGMGSDSACEFLIKLLMEAKSKLLSVDHSEEEHQNE